MRRIKSIRHIAAALIISFCSCHQEFAPDNSTFSLKTDETKGAAKTKATNISNTYERLPNPYALEVMQEVYDIYSETSVSLEATDLYVKFMPKDSLQLDDLRFEYNLEIFDYPLDIELEEGEVYIETDIPDTILTYVYTTVKPDFHFPNDIAYEIIEECYIPTPDEVIGTPTKAGEVNVEDAAYALLGYETEATTRTLAWAEPQGYIRVMDNSNGFMKPVKGVKVRCHRFVKWSTAYTNEAGSYTMNKQYRYNPHYALVFENVKSFDIWGNWGPIARANYNLGKQSKIGYSINLDVNCLAWKWASVNNSAYEYYKMCETTQITYPPNNLKIMVWESGSSAPMLRRVYDPIEFNGHSAILNFFINIGYGSIATKLKNLLRYILPDITIATEYLNGGQMSYADIYETVNHELAHASHFSKVGSEFWAKYISYIMTYGAYGDGTGKNAELCGIGEMWGYFMGYILMYEHFSYSIPSSFPGSLSTTWLLPHILWDIYTNNILTKKEIYDCLKPSVVTYTDFAQELYNSYPDKAIDIASIFSNYPDFKHNAILPEKYETNYDTFLLNEEINSSMIIGGQHIYVSNCTLKSGANLTINIDSSITIIKPFIIEQGSSLELRKTQ